MNSGKKTCESVLYISQCPHYWALLEQDLVEIRVAINEEGNLILHMEQQLQSLQRTTCMQYYVTREHVQLSTPVMLKQAWFQLPITVSFAGGTCIANISVSKLVNDERDSGGTKHGEDANTLMT
jgi:hypothetical protein